MKGAARDILNTDTEKEARPMQGKVEICGVNTAKLKVLKITGTSYLVKDINSLQSNIQKSPEGREKSHK